MTATANRRMVASREWRQGNGDKRLPDFVFDPSRDERAGTSGALGQRRLATKHFESHLDWNLDDKRVAEGMLRRHREMFCALRAPPPDIPRRTLVICNTVERAKKFYPAVCETLTLNGRSRSS